MFHRNINTKVCGQTYKQRALIFTHPTHREQCIRKLAKQCIETFPLPCPNIKETEQILRDESRLKASLKKVL